MQQTLVTQQLYPPLIIIHGGAGAYLKTTTKQQRIARGARLAEIAQIGLGAMRSGGAREAVLDAVAHMERDSNFNAGYGSKLQRDGVARVSAGLANGAQQRITSVFNVQGCLHPSALANALQNRGDRNLDGAGAAALMRELGVPTQDLTTENTVARWQNLLASGDAADPEAAIGGTGEPELDAARDARVPVPEDLNKDQRYGTVGAVAVDHTGQVWACTSTGGRGHEAVGRLTDSGMPAGNYAVPNCGVSATGFGEQIIDLDIAGRICTRILDGACVHIALERTFSEVASHGGLLGAIVAHVDGTVGYAHTTEACGVAWADSAGNTHIDQHGRPNTGP